MSAFSGRTRFEQAQTEFAQSMNLTLQQYQLLASRLSTEELAVVCELLSAHKHRSPFRASIDAHVRHWLDKWPPLGKPLTERQLKAIKPSWPVRIKFPTPSQFESSDSHH